MASIDQPGDESPEKLRRIAVHEAGHAVASFALGYPISHIWINRDPSPQDGEGDQPRHCVEWPHAAPLNEKDLRYVQARAIFAFAGDAAEMHLLGSRPDGEIFDHGADYWLAHTAAWNLFPENHQRHAFLEEMEKQAHALVRKPLMWHQIQTLADALLQQNEMTVMEVDSLLKHAAETFTPPPD